MEKFKRVLCVTLAGVMSCSVLGACGQKEVKETKTITWLMPGDKQSDVQSVMDAVNKIIEPKLGINLELNIIDTGAYQEKMNLIMSAGEYYDMAFTGYVNKYLKAVDNEALAPLSELIEKEAPELKEMIPDYMWEDATVNGEIYAVPNQQIVATQYAYMLQKDLVEKYNFDYKSVTKSEDLEPFLKAVKEGEPDIYPYRTNYGVGMWTLPKYEKLTNMIYVPIDGDSTQAVVIRDTPEFQQGINVLRDWFKKGYIRQDVEGSGDDSTLYKSGRFAVSGTTWKPGSEALVKANLGEEYVYAKIGEPYVPNRAACATMIGINKDCKYKSEVIKFISLLNSDKDLYNLLAYGIEGKHYTLTDDGKVKYIDNSGYSMKAAWKFGNQFNALLVDGDDENAYEDTKKMNDESKKSKLSGFYFDDSNVVNEISHMDAITNYPYGIGTKDPSEYMDEMNERYKAAGEDKVLAEIQGQIDEFLKEKK